jgi:hypothetical protein
MKGINGRRLRKHRRASGIYRLESLFRDSENWATPDGLETREVLKVGDTVHYIDGKLGDYLIVSVPETTSKASAIQLERELSEVAKKPVLVVTHNIAFLRATMLTGREREELKKKIQEATEGGEDVDSAQP